ncbi:hypothetical protein HDV06_005646 [Boothiomyces sp. JEL0866]|nr:hypothetical protein HDV06_005646 [Boothiomyces sp. JEL0866]
MSSKLPTISSLVSTEWLASRRDVVILDASWHLLPKQGPEPKGLVDYRMQHIPDARFIDLDLVSDPLSSLPHMMPSEADFAKHMGKLGISKNDHVVVYDSHGIFSAPRIWWMLKAFGHENVSVLDGGLKKWKHENRPLASAMPEFNITNYEIPPEVNPEMIINYSQLLTSVSDFTSSHKDTILDARSPGRFAGSDPEPRPGLPSGHCPSAINIPFGILIDSESGCLKPPAQLQAIFDEKRINLDLPIVTMCGSGVTAAIIYLALDQIGKKTKVRLYDGSWTEWASMKNSPIKTY